MNEFKNTLKDAKGISISDLAKSNSEYKESDKNTIVRHALSQTPINLVCRSKDFDSLDKFHFSIDIKTMTATNQKASGRCWIFAACNVLREIIAKKCNIKNFELSQSYIAFYDKFEKVNYALESVIDLLDKDPDDRVLTYILQNGIADGGQWDMFVNIVNKYGICPKGTMDETYQSSNTRLVNDLLNVELRHFSAHAKKIYLTKGIDAVRKFKDEKLKVYYNFLCNCYGKPVEKFDFEYVDANDNYHLDQSFTPKDFFNKYIGSTLDEYVSLINSPTSDKPYYDIYTIAYLGNVIEGKKITHINLPIERLKELVLSQLKDNEIVWFGSDCSKYGDRELGVWDQKAFDYVTPFNMDYSMEKCDALDYHASVMNHAMVITGVSLKDNNPTKWKIENSWGSDRAFNGYYLMSDEWFDSYVYQAVVNKKYLNEKEKAALSKELTVLKPWDPMGSLAD